MAFLVFFGASKKLGFVNHKSPENNSEVYAF